MAYMIGSPTLAVIDSTMVQASYLCIKHGNPYFGSSHSTMLWASHSQKFTLVARNDLHYGKQS